MITQRLLQMMHAILVTVIALKMNGPDEIDDEFNLKVEMLDKEFLNRFKEHSSSPEDLEREYQQRLAELISLYEQSFQVFLDSQRAGFARLRQFGNVSQKESKEKEEGALDMSRPFQSIPLDLRLTRKQQWQIDWGLYSFKKRLAFRKFYRSYVPGFFLTGYFRFRIFLRLFSNACGRINYRFVASLTNMGRGFVGHVQQGTSALFTFLKRIVLWIRTFFLEKILRRKKEESVEQSEDAKIAAKLLEEKPKKI